jgi:hypothetical protein
MNNVAGASLAQPLANDKIRIRQWSRSSWPDTSWSDLINENKEINGRAARFQLTSSWKRRLCPETQAFPTRFALETEMSAAGLLVSNSPRVGNGSVSRRSCCFQLGSTLKWAARPRKSLCPTQAELETQAILGKAAVFKSSLDGSGRPALGQPCFQLNSSW